MPRPLAPDATLANMIYACAWTIATLKAAAKMDFKLAEPEKKKFADMAAELTALLGPLTVLQKDASDLRLGADLTAQATVVIGDEVQDRTVRDGNRTTKAELAGKPGLGAEHAFGKHVDDLVRTDLALEPDAVKRAAGRLAELPPFASKDKIAADLTKAADQQAAALDERTTVGSKADGLRSKGIGSVAKCSEALSKVEGDLLKMFPRQYGYVGRFFADFSRPAKPAAGDDPTKK